MLDMPLPYLPSSALSTSANCTYSMTPPFWDFKKGHALDLRKSCLLQMIKLPTFQYSFKSRVSSLSQSILFINGFRTSAIWIFNALHLLFTILYTRYKMIFFHYLYLSNKMIHIPFMHNINVFNDDDAWMLLKYIAFLSLG